MKEGLFRKESLDRISSPEQVDGYIKTTTIRVWIIFIAASLLLVGAAIWGFYGSVDITVSGVAVCENDTVYCFVSENDRDKISDSATTRINSESYTFAGMSKLPVPAKGNISDYALHLADFDENDWMYYALLTDAYLEDGIYKAEIVIESVSPISLLMN